MRTSLVVMLVGLAIPAYGTDYNIKVWSYSGDLEASTVQKALDGAADILTSDNQPGDIACPTNFNIRGNIYNGAADSLPKSLETKADMTAFRKDGRFSLYVVKSIRACGDVVAGQGQRIGGCTGLNGGPVVVSVGSLRGVVVGHEFGHGQGLRDDYDNSGLLMYYTALTTGLRVTQPHCDSFDAGQLFPVMDVAAGAQPEIYVPVMEADAAKVEMAEADIPLDELLNGYWHQIPVPNINALTEDDLAEVRTMLEGEPSVSWQNAVTILGLRGSPEDATLLDSVIDRSSAIPEAEIINGDVPWFEIQANAQLALGLLFNRTQDPATLGLIYDQMTAPESAIPAAGNDIETFNDVASNAAEAFQIAGAGALEAYPTALKQAEITTLLRNGVIAADAPINSVLLSTRWQDDVQLFEDGDTVAEALKRLDDSNGQLTLPGFDAPRSYTDLLINAQSFDPGPATGGEIRDFFEQIDPNKAIVWDDLMIQQQQQ